MSSESTSKGPPSKQWLAFHKALELAIKRVAHKWTYDDFAECFPLWSEKQPEGANATFHQVSTHLENSIMFQVGVILESETYRAQENIDTLATVLADAKKRKKDGTVPGNDVWREDITPRASVHSRVVPMLEQERDRLKEILAALNEDNLAKEAEFQANVVARDAADAEVMELMKLFDKMYAEFQKIPLDEIEEWSIQLQESNPPRMRV